MLKKQVPYNFVHLILIEAFLARYSTYVSSIFHIYDKNLKLNTNIE